jgi:hypothetical protein
VNAKGPVTFHHQVKYVPQEIEDFDDGDDDWDHRQYMKLCRKLKLGMIGMTNGVK